MSILDIGKSSRYYHSSPGARHYYNPFLSKDQKEQLLKMKEKNQSRYKQFLLRQIKQKQKKKKQTAKNLLSHQQDKYKSFKFFDNRSNQYYSPAHNNSQFKNRWHSFQKNLNNQQYYPVVKQNNIILPTLQSSDIFLKNRFTKNCYQAPKIKLFNQNSSNPLINHSLFEIGQKLRQSNQELFINPNNNRCKTIQFIERPSYNYSQLSRLKHRHDQDVVQRHLRQRAEQVYDLLNYSRNILSRAKINLKQMRNKLKTESKYDKNNSFDKYLSINKKYFITKKNFYQYGKRQNYSTLNPEKHIQ